jgi:hypothetical protein
MVMRNPFDKIKNFRIFLIDMRDLLLEISEKLDQLVHNTLDKYSMEMLFTRLEIR